MPGLWCEGLGEAPASVPGPGRDPGHHEAGGLGAAPRRRQGKAAARRGTRTAAAGPPGCGDERGGSSRERLNRGGRRQGSHDRALPARAGHCHLGRYGSPRPGRAAITGDSGHGDATSPWDLSAASTYLGLWGWGRKCPSHHPAALDPSRRLNLFSRLRTAFLILPLASWSHRGFFQSFPLIYSMYIPSNRF